VTLDVLKAVHSEYSRDYRVAVKTVVDDPHWNESLELRSNVHGHTKVFIGERRVAYFRDMEEAVFHFLRMAELYGDAMKPKEEK
jgi:hypothetical protein